MTPRRRLVLEIAAIVAGGGVIGAGAIVLAMGSCEPLFPCEDEQISRQTSPDGTREVRVFVRDCGATTTWATHVVVSRKRWLLPDASHTVFVAVRGDVTPAGPGHGPEVRVSWLGPRSVRLVHHPTAQIARSEREAEEVTVDWQPFP